jgi:hypothetical protein
MPRLESFVKHIRVLIPRNPVRRYNRRLSFSYGDGAVSGFFSGVYPNKFIRGFPQTGDVKPFRRLYRFFGNRGLKPSNRVFTAICPGRKNTVPAVKKGGFSIAYRGRVQNGGLNSPRAGGDHKRILNMAF